MNERNVEALGALIRAWYDDDETQLTMQEYLAANGCLAVDVLTATEANELPTPKSGWSVTDTRSYGDSATSVRSELARIARGEAA